MRVQRLHGDEAEHGQQQQGGDEIGALHRVTILRRDDDVRVGCCRKDERIGARERLYYPVTPELVRRLCGGCAEVVFRGRFRSDCVTDNEVS
jgi:hypothetical protein